jgi:hypothetical protein
MNNVIIEEIIKKLESQKREAEDNELYDMALVLDGGERMQLYCNGRNAGLEEAIKILKEYL